MSDWQPQQAGLDQLIQTFSAALSPDNAVQEKVRQSLEAFHKEADYSNYCVYLFCNKSLEFSTRFQAGLALKNHITLHYSTMTQQNIDFIKKHILNELADPVKPLRNTVGSITSGLLKKITIFRWPELLPTLIDYLQKPDLLAVEGALSILKILIEDCPLELETDSDGAKPLTTIFPGIINFIGSSEESIRLLSLDIMNQALYCNISSVEIYLETFLNALFQRIQDTSIGVHKELCRAFVFFIGSYHQLIIPHFKPVADYIFQMTSFEDTSVALEACEFWLALVEHEGLASNIRPLLGNLIPQLLKGMVYGEDELLEAEEALEDSSVPDRDQDIRPHHHQGREHGASHEESDEEGGFGDKDLDVQWNLRKCSAASLDQLSNIFGNEILDMLLPLIFANLQHSEWSQRECGILALGAVAEGCFSGLVPHLPQLISYLRNSLKDPQPLVRSISCWTLSRFCEWYISESEDSTDHQFVPVMEGLLQMAVDNNKRVQEAGITAFTILVNSARHLVIPYLEPIVGHINIAFSKYQRKNLPLLYDLLAVLSYAAGEKLGQQRFLDVFMPALIHKWNELQDDNTDLFPLFECLSALICSIGPNVAKYVGPIYQRCIRISSNILQQDQMYRANPALPEADKDFLIVSLDLMSGIVQGFQMQMIELSNSMQPSLMSIVASCINDPNAEVGQSAYAAIGDLAANCFPLIQPHLEEIMTNLLANFKNHVQFTNLCNNVIWASGEIALKWGPAMQPFVLPLLQEYVPLLNNETTSRALGENLAIALGRFGLVASDIVAPHLQHFSDGWCKAITHVEYSAEKDSAFQGICLMAQKNPPGLQHSFVLFCLAIERLRTPSEQCFNLLKEVLHMYKGLSGQAWDQFALGFAESTRQDLQLRFGV